MAKTKAQQDLLIAHLVGGGNASSFASKHGIPDRTARSWAASKTVRDAVEAANRESGRQIVTVLSRTGAAAAIELSKLALKSQDEKIRLGACRTVLQQLVEISKFTELEQQMTDLTNRLAVIEGTGNEARVVANP
jgi:hypothetical protein